MKPSAAVVIEDDPDNCRLIQTLLHSIGFTVHTAATGPEGVEAIRYLGPALVTTDLNLPGFGGVEVIRRVRLFTPVPIMIVSASQDLWDLQAGFGAGADSYLPKPFRPKVLKACVEALLRRPPLVG